jgi:hypothetical protein
MKKSYAIALSVVLISTFVIAQTKVPTSRAQSPQRTVTIHAGTQCGQDPILPTDGSIQSDYVATGTANWYLVNLKAHRSYSVEVYDNLDPVIAGTPSLTLTATDCQTTLPTTDVAQIDPDLTGDGDRISWIQAADAQAYVQVNSSDPNGNAYNIRIVDTTLVNPRWSTYSGFSTQWAFVNNTSVPITGTLTVYDHTNTVLNTFQESIPATGEVFQIFASPINHYGFATFAFVGPAGSVNADAYFINSNATVVVPSTLAPRNYQH